MRQKSLACLLGCALLVAYGCSGDDGGTAGTGGFSGSSAGGSSAGGSGNSGGSSSGGTFNLDGGGSGGGGGFAADAGCAFEEKTGSLLPANLLFVIDKSGSMNCNLPADGQSTAECETSPQKKFPAKPSKWELTRAALKNAIDSLEMSGNPTSVGVTMFPSDSTCGVASVPNVTLSDLTSQQNTGIDAFLDTVAPEGRTPIAGATILTYNYLLSQWNNLFGNTFVVLLTDGFETCAPGELDKLLNQDVPNAKNLLGVRSFVIGAPGSEDARALLSQLAWAGGTATSTSCTHSTTPANVGDCHFDMTTVPDFATGLSQALAAISGTVLSCEVDVPQPTGGGPVDYNKVNVQLNGMDIFQDNSTGCDMGADGWQYNADKSKILLCGPACDAAKQPNASIKIVLGCPTKVP